MIVVITIDGKAEAKGRGRVGSVKLPTGKNHITVFTPAHTRKYEARIRDEASKIMKQRNPFEGAVEVFVHVYLPLPKSMSRKNKDEAVAGRLRPCTRPDIDNYVKTALDGINNIVIQDDNQVVALHAYKVYRIKPALRIEVRACSEKPGSVIW